MWTTAADGKQLLRQISKRPGFGEQKTKIFVALLGKQLGVNAAGVAGGVRAVGEEGSYCSIADIASPESRIKVRDFKKAMKAAAKSGAA